MSFGWKSVISIPLYDPSLYNHTIKQSMYEKIATVHGVFPDVVAGHALCTNAPLMHHNCFFNSCSAFVFFFLTYFRQIQHYGH